MTAGRDLDALLLILENACEYDNVSDANERELKRLVRLGKWAETKLMPALDEENYLSRAIETALDEMPK